MHEFSLAQAIVSQALEAAERHGNLPVQEVRVLAGVLRQIVPEIMETAFDAAKQETLAADARLVLREVPALIQCKACLACFEPDDVFWICPNCSGSRCQALTGDELLLHSVILSDDAGAPGGSEPNEPARGSRGGRHGNTRHRTSIEG